MASRRELVAYVRFRLEQLTVQNAQHEFEQLCRQLVRLRICSNVIPATGPVSARGDQGRDAESFRAHLENSPLASSTFMGLVADRPLAFAFTLQKKVNDLKGKIERDVAKIASGSRAFSEVHYMCADDLDVGTRHLLQDRAKSEYGVLLEIYDGQAIAELLCWPDTFWIATEYLQVPSEMFPDDVAGEEDEWYEEAFGAWRDPSARPLTYGEFADVKRLLRHSTVSKKRQIDLRFWMERVERFLEGDVPTPLRLRAMYELAVAALRGLGTMEGHDSRLHEYFPAAVHSDDVADLEDASVLLTYCLGAVHNHATILELDDLLRWRDELIHTVNQQLEGNPAAGRRCDLLSILAHIACTSEAFDPVKSTRSAVDIWLEITSLLEKATLFPVNRLAKLLVLAVPILGDDPRFEELTRRVDAFVADRIGQAAAAERCRDRAIAFHKQGKILRAISELHEAKIKWFGDETLRGSVLSTLFIGRCYQELGLHYAAKYYAMIAAWVSMKMGRQELFGKSWEAALMASESDYLLGNWCGYLRFANIAMMSHWWFVRQAGDFDAHPDLDRVIYHGAICQAIAERVLTDGGAAVRESISGWGLSPDIDNLLPSARKIFSGMEIDQILNFAAKQLSGRPFSDLASVREVVWEAMGVTWRVHWKNDPATTAAAEELIATLQVAIAEFARHDLLTMKFEAEIEVVTGDVSIADLTSLSGNEDRRWKVVLPAESTQGATADHQRDIQLLSIAISVLREASLLPQDEFMKVFEHAVRAGITANVFFARPYAELYRYFLAEPRSLDQLALSESLGDVWTQEAVPAHGELRWKDALAPGYDEEEAREAIALRYERIPRSFPITLTRLANDEDFQRTRAVLAQEGWRDWHVLLAVGNLIYNARLHVIYGPTWAADKTKEEVQAAASDLMYNLDLEATSPMDLGLFSYDRIREMLNICTVTVLQTWGLEVHQVTPDFPAIQNFLAVRYRFLQDDIEHEDPFVIPPTGDLSLPFSSR